MLTEDRDREADAASRAVRSSLRRHAAEIERAELARAVSALDARGELTDEQRAVLAETAAAIVDGLLEDPEAALAAGDDPELARGAAALFDLGE